MKTLLAGVLVAAGLLLAAGPALAHHAFSAEFDANKPVTLTGTVTKVEWTNPHAWFYIDVADAAGKVTNWAFELGGPNTLIREGWTRNSMKPGDVVTVEGSRAKDGSPIANAQAVTLKSTGKRLFAASSRGQQQ
jgi:DNA/RNA endonuclease YhcR with UshA esterase domain